MKDGIKFNSIYLISLEELMVHLILKHCESKFMPIVELEEYISQIDFIQKKNYPMNLSYSCQSKRNKCDLYIYYINAQFIFNYYYLNIL